jgi:crotonobetainyl-CoA:carnitine CoA-transferase CaiB-like acyl-CoA transferase
MALTGKPDGEPLVAGAGAALVVKNALDAIARRRPDVALPGVELLGERAALAGWSRNAPWTVGGAGRAVKASDGWWFLSLPRDTDRASIPALVESDQPGWDAIDAWSRSRSRYDAVERAQLLGLAAAMIRQPDDAPDDQALHRRECGVLRTAVARRAPADVPLVVDLSSLWAGPLCASLLGAIGCQVVKVESTRRLDGARNGPAAFFDLLHAGHDMVTVDFATRAGRDQLRHLLHRADVVIEASRPRVMEQLRIDPLDVAAGGAIWVSLTAYGRTGPWRNRVGFGDDVAAGAGLVAWLDGTPVPVGDAIADPLAGVVAAAAVVEALDEDEAVLLDVAMRDVAAHAQQMCLQAGCSPYPAIASPPTARRPHGAARPAGADNAAWLPAGARA